MNLKARFVSWVTGLAILAGCLTCFGQTSGSIDGTVYDTSGAAVSGAPLTLINTETRAIRTATTSAEGFFRFVDLFRGHYELKVSASGFTELTMSALELTVGQQLRVRPVLQIGALAQSVEVAGTPPPVSTSSASLARLVDSRRIEQLPLNGRNALQLLTLVPGVIDAGTEGNLGAVQSVFRVAGGRTVDMNFNLDGGFNMNTYTDVANEYPNPDALQEFLVSVRTYTATFGRGSSMVSAVTKSGTNQLHGSAFEFLRNTDLDSRPFFATDRSVFKRNQYGGTLGGPAVKDRAFFFVSYQGTKQRGSPGEKRYRTLNEAERKGDFSASKAVTDPSTGRPFPNNLIPVSRIRSFATKFMSQYLPAANSGTDFYSFGIAQKLDQNQLVTKGDYSFSARARVSYRYLLNDIPQTGVAAASIPSNAWLSTMPTRMQSHLFAYTHLFSSRLINDVRLTYVNNAFGHTIPIKFSLADLGLGVDTTNSITQYGLTPHSVLNVTGFFQAQLPNPAHDHDTTVHFNDIASWTSGKHNIQFGAEFYRNGINHLSNFQTGGNLNFSGTVTGNAAADFLLGQFNTYKQISASPQQSRQFLPSLFVQEDLRLQANLTLNLGLRWEPFFGWTEANGKLGAFLPGVQSKVFPNMAPGMVFPGDAGLDKSIIGSRLNNFAPRVGVAWDVRGNGRTSVRAGFGLYYVPLTKAIDFGQFTLNQPFAVNVTVSGGDTDNLFGRPPFNGVNPFPWPDASNLSALQAIPFKAGLNFTALNTLFKTSASSQWSLSVQQAMGTNAALEVSYIGSASSHIFGAGELNPAVFIPGQSTLANTQARRIYSQFGSITQWFDGISTNYNSLLVSFNRRYAAGFSILASYGWSKGLGTVVPVSTSTGVIVLRDPSNYHRDYGPLDGDIKHNFVTSIVWDVPLDRLPTSKLVRTLIGGWQLSGINTLRSGPPFTIRAGKDNSLVSIANDTADQVGDWRLPSGRSRGQQIAQYFNPAAFAQNPIGTFGTTGVNSMRAPGLWSVDFAAAKALYKAERRRLDLRASFFNLFNHPNLGTPVAVQNSPSFGSITSAGTPRVIEFGLKFAF